MTHRTPLIPLVLFALVVLPRPAAAAPDKAHLQLMADIRMLQEQAAQLQLLLSSLGDALKTVTTKLDEQAGINRKAFADQKLLVDNLTGDVRVVREKVDDTNVRITALSTEMEALRLAIPRTAPPPTLPDAAAPGATDPSAPAAAPAQPPSSPAPLGVSPQRMYDTAYSDYAGGQWTLAIEGFSNYIRSFPRSEQADDAQYMIGDSYFLDNKFREAIAAYDALIKNYPTSNKLPEAHYKRGYAFENLKQYDQARAAYEYASKTFPNTDAGGLAKQGLDRLKREGK